MFTKILGYSFLLCLVGLFGIGLYEVYMTAGLAMALAIATMILGAAAFFAAVTEDWIC